MANNYLRAITRGETLAGYPTDAHNAFYETYRRVFQTPGQPNGPGSSSGSQTLEVEVFNVSGVAMDSDFPVLKLTQPVITYTDNDQAIHDGIVFEGDTPDADTTIDQIAIVQGPIGQEATGSRRAVLMGPTWCKVDISDATHTHAKPIDGVFTYLESGTSGARIVWKESGTGIKFAQIILGGGGAATSANRWGRVSTAITAATGNDVADWGSGAVKFMDDATGSTDSSPTTVDNLWDTGFVVKSMVLVDTGFSPPRVLNGTCEAFETWTYSVTASSGNFDIAGTAATLTKA